MPCAQNYTKQTSNINTSNTAQFSTTSQTSGSTSLIHRSLDFSNVSLNEESGNTLRKYHQTRLYINDFCNMYHHGNKQGCGKTYLISANLPENVSYQIGSSWGQPLGIFGNATFNLFMQTAGKWASQKLGDYFDKNLTINSGINRASTIQIWDGTKPLSLTLKIPVIDDAVAPGVSGVRTNLVEALEFLGSLCLPAEHGNVGFYTPPPSPLKFTLAYNKDENNQVKSVTFESSYARISLQLGGILFVDNCIVESISIDYPNTKTMTIKEYYGNNSINTNAGQYYLTPLFANVTIKITTIEATTANTYSRMLWMNDQTDQGQGSADVSWVLPAIENQVKNIFTTNSKQPAQKPVENPQGPM